MDDFWSRFIYTIGVLWLYIGERNAMGATDISIGNGWLHMIIGIVLIIISARIYSHNETKKK